MASTYRGVSPPLIFTFVNMSSISRALKQLELERPIRVSIKGKVRVSYGPKGLAARCQGKHMEKKLTFHLGDAIDVNAVQHIDMHCSPDRREEMMEHVMRTLALKIGEHLLENRMITFRMSEDKHRQTERVFAEFLFIPINRGR